MLLGSLPICSWSFDKIRVIYYRELTTKPFENENLCLALLLMWPKLFWSVQNCFGLTKLIWTWPYWFGHDQNEMVTTKMKWSGPNVIYFGRKSQFRPGQFILVVTISFWSWPNQYGQVQINLVRPKPFWTDQNCFGHIEGQGINV